jgi:hypothetical protein
MLIRSCGIFSPALVATIAGCLGSGKPAALALPEVDPPAAAKAAISAYDKNGDGAIGGDELAAVPAIERHLTEYDKDSNKSVSEQEIADRLKVIYASGTMTPFVCTILYNNQPLEGATVTFEPEVFLADQLKPATGTTGYDGTARILVADSDLPEPNRKLRSMYMGVYKVSVTHPSVQIPKAYQGKETVLGYDVNGAATWGDKVTWQLDSRGSKPKVAPSRT